MAIDPITPGVVAGAWLWDKYGKSLADKAVDVAKGRWRKVRWDEAADAYRAKIKKLYGSMQIMGMAEPVPLDDIFIETYILDKPTAFARFDIERLKQLSSDPDASLSHAARINGLMLVVEKDVNLFILGKPGAGKTTFLKYIALKAAEKTIDKVPIFISLKHWADSGLELLPFIAERFDIFDFPAAQSFFEELLKSGSAIILFDGLDEVNQEGGQRDKLTRAMNNFVEKYDRVQSLITCRIAASDYSFKPFTYVEIADFTEDQIRIFVGKWFRDDRAKRDKFLTEFTKADNKGLREMARTPLLLTLLCLAFDQTLTFPQRRVEIYEEAVEALLRKWDSSRRIRRDEAYRKLSLGHKENMLARIAAETFEKNEYFIPQVELEKRITEYVKNIPPYDSNDATDGKVILKAIEAQHGILVERAREVYSFLHLTFQEYFTAKYIVANAGKGTLTHLVKAHSADRRWREVFLLTTSLLPDASQLMTTFRHGIDDLLEGDKKLIALLTWTDKKSNSIQLDNWLVRQIYLFISSYHMNLLDGHDLVRTPDLALDLDLTRALVIARARTHARDRDRYHAYALDIARILNLDRAVALDLDLALAYIRARAPELEIDELEKDLSALLLPVDKATGAEWKEFADKLQALMVKHRDIAHEWTLTERQEELLDNYLTASSLLQDCLELAVMPPNERKTILNSLYLPPPQMDDAQDT